MIVYIGRIEKMESARMWKIIMLISRILIKLGKIAGVWNLFIFIRGWKVLVLRLVVMMMGMLW